MQTESQNEVTKNVLPEETVVEEHGQSGEQVKQVEQVYEQVFEEPVADSTEETDSTEDLKLDELEGLLSEPKEKVKYEVVFFVRYREGCRLSSEEITNFFNNYGQVHHVNCPENRDYVFVFMASLSTTAEYRRTRATISQIIADMPQENRFHITVASSNRPGQMRRPAGQQYNYRNRGRNFQPNFQSNYRPRNYQPNYQSNYQPNHRPNPNRNSGHFGRFRNMTNRFGSTSTSAVPNDNSQRQIRRNSNTQNNRGNLYESRGYFKPAFVRGQPLERQTDTNHSSMEN